MKSRIERLWRLARGRIGRSADAAVGRAGGAVGGAQTDRPSILTVDGPDAGPPEQPVLLLPSGPRTVHVGELLPARQSRWPLSVVRLPVVPKRAILAAGVFAGLAGPTIAKHLATRMLLGGASAAKADGVLEITRIVYSGPLTPRATNAITRAILAARR